MYIFSEQAEITVEKSEKKRKPFKKHTQKCPELSKTAYFIHGWVWKRKIRILTDINP